MSNENDFWARALKGVILGCIHREGMVTSTGSLQTYNINALQDRLGVTLSAEFPGFPVSTANLFQALKYRS